VQRILYIKSSKIVKTNFIFSNKFISIYKKEETDTYL